MEKEALIDIILNDIKEVETLVRTFKGKSSISPAFLKLTKTKLINLTEELELLGGFHDSIPEPSEPQLEFSESSLTSPPSSSDTGMDGEKIAASSDQFIREEAIEIPVSKPELSPEPVASSTKIEEKIEEPVKKESAQIGIEKVVVPVISEAPPTPPSPVAEPKKTELPKAAKKGKEPGILGEQIGKEKTSVYERVSTQKDQTESIKQIGKPVSDIRKAFGLNDRFYFQRELFNGNPDLFNQTLDQINQMDSYDSATHFLRSNFQWTDENEVADSFLKSVKRRFI
ncbi:MAG: hypothetical protein JEZ14_00555 [Marinilabiliaceae bacterium]|nr:hypothetical protein [Marinilabiliaceae bacterium]